MALGTGDRAGAGAFCGGFCGDFWFGGKDDGGRLVAEFLLLEEGSALDGRASIWSVLGVGTCEGSLEDLDSVGLGVGLDLGNVCCVCNFSDEDGPSGKSVSSSSESCTYSADLNLVSNFDGVFLSDFLVTRPVRVLLAAVLPFAVGRLAAGSLSLRFFCVFIPDFGAVLEELKPLPVDLSVS